MSSGLSLKAKVELITLKIARYSIKWPHPMEVGRTLKLFPRCPSEHPHWPGSRNATKPFLSTCGSPTPASQCQSRPQSQWRYLTLRDTYGIQIQTQMKSCNVEVTILPQCLFHELGYDWVCVVALYNVHLTKVWEGIWGRKDDNLPTGCYILRLDTYSPKHIWISNIVHLKEQGIHIFFERSSFDFDIVGFAFETIPMIWPYCNLLKHWILYLEEYILFDPTAQLWNWFHDLP